MISKPRMVACPNCKQLSEFTPKNAFRPFCSERCKLIDLGLWANEEYAIAEPMTDEFADEIASELNNTKLNS